MRYKIKNLEIRSENAAKPASQASSYLVSWLCNQETVDQCLDFGCGKLRYTSSLRSMSNQLTLVDSEIQLCREQIIKGELTSVYQYVAKHFIKTRVLNTEEFKRDRTKFDFILCANVLSAIPDLSARTEAMCQIRTKLKKNGTCLFVTQFRSSYFTAIAKSKTSTPHLDGWIQISRRGAFYYGILSKKNLEEITIQEGFVIRDSWVVKDSAYVLVGNA